MTSVLDRLLQLYIEVSKDTVTGPTSITQKDGSLHVGYMYIYFVSLRSILVACTRMYSTYVVAVRVVAIPDGRSGADG